MSISDITIQLPLENTTLIFAVVLLVILFSPLLLHRLRIPYIVGLIFAGILLGPKAFNILANDESFHLFGNVGILYILFLAGIDMDMNDFQRNRVKGMTFGLFTFSIPIIIGTFTSLYILHFSLMTSLLLAAMKYINRDQLLNLAEPLRKNNYGEYLIKIANEPRENGNN